MSSARGQLRPAAEVMLRPEEFQESRAGTADEESWTRRLDPCPIPPPGEEIRSDTSEILDETIPLTKGKVMEMNHVSAKVDKLEAFVKMVAHHVSFLKEQVLEAEKSQSSFLNTVCKLFQCASASSFKKSQPPSAARSYDLPKLYRTEDYFPVSDVGTKYPNQ
ncbi:breast carcinoma-amplified sequence 4 isoform X3 [Melanerpes formicivorus]|uniref:breast carcinoma-amplified sequence 4 isoform X3 n=1 Tax=Melanerpes formicivorus TaxID=211600 RepID=UPI0035900406